METNSNKEEMQTQNSVNTDEVQDRNVVENTKQFSDIEEDTKVSFVGVPYNGSDLKITEQDIKIATINSDGSITNPKKYIENNWIKEGVDNNILSELKEHGFKIFANSDGTISYSINDGEMITETVTNACRVFSAMLGKPITMKFQKKLTDNEPVLNNIEPHDLMIVVETKFNPKVKSEFYKIGGHYLRNKFIPTPFMELVGAPLKDPKFILKLMFNLSSNDNKRLNYFINWLAYIFQNLEKPQTTILNIGVQGTGKGIMWDIIRRLFGEDQTMVLDDQALSQTFLQSMFDGKIFIFLDEISQGTVKNNKLVKNLIKAIITNARLPLQAKYKNTTKETELKAAVYIASNEYKSMELEKRTEEQVFLELMKHW